MEDDAGASELSCPVCKGFLIDAVTLTLCSHSFCRSCLLRQLQIERKCPECDNQLNEIENAFCRDTTLQAFVYKYVPSTFWKEIKQRSDFIKKQSPTDEELQIIADWNVADFGQYLCLPDEMLSFSVEFLSRDEILSEQLKHHSSPSTSEDHLSNEAISPKKSVFCRYFRCPAEVKIKHLKSLLEGKLELPDNYVLYFIELDTGEIIEETYSLQDLVYIFGWTRQKPFKLHFTLTPLVPEEDKPPVLEVELIDQSEAIDSGPPPLDLEPITKMPAFTVNLSSSLFAKEHKGACLNGGGELMPRPAIITTASEMPPKKKRRIGPRKEKPAQLTLQEKRNSFSSVPTSTISTPTTAAATPTPPHPSFADVQSPPPQQQRNNLQTLSPSLTTSTTKLPLTGAAMNGNSKGQSPTKNCFDLTTKISAASAAATAHSSTSSPINGFSKLATSSPTLLTVEQSNNQLSQVLAPIHSAPNTPIPNEFHDQKPNLQTIPLSKSADKNRDEAVFLAMRQQMEVVRTMKIHENNFIIGNRPNFMTMQNPQIFP